MRLLPLPGVFQPPSDAWLLTRHIAREHLGTGTQVLDLCTGSGVLAIAAALGGAGSVTAVDISRRAAVTVRLNGWLNGVRIEALRGNLFEPVAERRFDLIVSNPPYLPGESPELPGRGLARAWEGGPTGRRFIEQVAQGARDHLTPTGAVLLVYSTVCGEPETLAALADGGLEPRVIDRRRGPLGPILQARADYLRRRGVLLDRGDEELLVVRATVARPAESASRSRVPRRSTSSPARAPDRSARARGAAS